MKIKKNLQSLTYVFSICFTTIIIFLEEFIEVNQPYKKSILIMAIIIILTTSKKQFKIGIIKFYKYLSIMFFIILYSILINNSSISYNILWNWIIQPNFLQMIFTILILSFIKSYKDILKYYYYFSFFCIPMLHYLISENTIFSQKHGSYMGFGFLILPYIMILIEKIFREGIKMIRFLYIVYSFYLIINYANRGVLVVLFVYVLYKLIKRFKWKIIICLSGLFYTIYLNNEKIVLLLREKFNLSRTVITLIGFLEGKMDVDDFSSGRFTLLDIGKKLFDENPIFGKGIAFFTQRTGVVYSHNIILDFLISFGFIGTIIIVSLLLIKLIYKIFYEVDLYKLLFLEITLFSSFVLFFSQYFFLNISFNTLLFLLA